MQLMKEDYLSSGTDESCTQTKATEELHDINPSKTITQESCKISDDDWTNILDDVPQFYRTGTKNYENSSATSKQSYSTNDSDCEPTSKDSDYVVKIFINVCCRRFHHDYEFVGVNFLKIQEINLNHLGKIKFRFMNGEHHSKMERNKRVYFISRRHQITVKTIQNS
jgi:hypothetical protein